MTAGNELALLCAAILLTIVIGVVLIIIPSQRGQ